MPHLHPNGAGADSGAYKASPSSYQSHVNEAVKKGLPKEWVPTLSEIVKKESSFNPNAKNPKSTAKGYGQFLDSTRQNYEKKNKGKLSYNNPADQLVMMGQYVKDRYGTPANALAFWNKNGYY